MNLKQVPKPPQGYLVVELLNMEEIKTKSGIIYPDKKNVFFAPAKVKAVGDNMFDYEMQTKVGDIIMVKEALTMMSSETFLINDVSHFLIREQSGFFGHLSEEDAAKYRNG